MISMFIDTCTNHFILGIYKENKQLYFENEETKNGNNVFIRKKLKIIGIFTMKIMMVKKI